MPLRININGTVRAGAALLGFGSGGAPGSGANNRTRTLFEACPGLGATAFGEDEELGRERNGRSGLGLGSPGVLSPGVIESGVCQKIGGRPGDMPSGFGMGSTITARMRTQTCSMVTRSGSMKTPAEYTMPDLEFGNTGMISPAESAGERSSGTPQSGTTLGQSNPTPLTPVVSLPTSGAEAQISLAKVVEPDFDAFLTYVAIVPKYCRFGGLSVGAIV